MEKEKSNVKPSAPVIRAGRLLILLWVVIKSIRGGKKATAEVWDNPEGLEWTVPSPAPYHTFATAPEVR